MPAMAGRESFLLVRVTPNPTMTNEASMKMHLSSAAILLVLSFLATPSAAQSAASVEKEILALETKMNEAYAANDLPTYFAYYSADSTQWLPEGRTDLPQYEKQWTAFIQKGNRVESYEISDMPAVPVGPSTDVVRGQLPARSKDSFAEGGRFERKQSRNRRLVQARWRMEGRTPALFSRAQEEVDSRPKQRRTFMSDSHDRALGMDRPITRRDFMNGAAMVIGAAMLPHRQVFGAAGGAEPQNRPGYDPPVKVGLRGSHPGSFEAAHSLRDGTFWKTAGKPVDTGEDLRPGDCRAEVSAVCPLLTFSARSRAIRSHPDSRKP